ncbi:hypothetical protein FRX31_005569 [Thalictrum thalictroides]|uniref:Uncharacterized protein n=1 Tax=Thalictrum thalictroides TaxID=46969 RepID=A0A7J6X571_THATH|nr:hypothetical protein FRX31_005569 [Thalictrum thalictroides]
MNLYLIAFYAHHRGYQFESEFEIDHFSMLKPYDGKYTSQPWKHIGPKTMVDVVNLFAEQDSLDISLSVKACEVFFVHLSDAARLCPVESLVCKSLAPLEIGKFDKRTLKMRRWLFL